MPIKLTVEYSGWGEMGLALRNLPNSKAYKDVLQTGLVAGARVYRNKIKQSTRFKDKTGNLRKSIKGGPGRARYRPSAIVQAKAPHVHLLQSGTKRRYTRTGAHRGVGPRTDFFFSVIRSRSVGAIALKRIRRSITRDRAKVRAYIKGETVAIRKRLARLL